MISSTCQIMAAAAAAAQSATNVIEPRSDKAFFTFGRYQPPTVGHQALINKMIEDAKAAGADAYVFASSKHEPAAKLRRSLTPHNKRDKWPINAQMKYNMFKEHYDDLSQVRIITSSPTAFAAVNALTEAGYTDLTIYLGSDQVTPSAENPTPLGVSLQRYPMLKIVSVERDQAVGNTPKGMSGTKMREAAVAGNLNRFAAGIGLPREKAKSYMNRLRKFMGVEGGAHKRRTKKKSRKTRK
jgi:hypothetical protein